MRAFFTLGFALNACRILQTCDAKEYALCSTSRTAARDGCSDMLHTRMSDRTSKLEEVTVGTEVNRRRIRDLGVISSAWRRVNLNQ